MALRVCIFVEPMPYHWTSFYVKAFRERCDVVSVGPKPDESLLKEGWRSGAHDAVVPPDIEVDFVGPWDLYDLLPAGWQPDLVVGISGMGGRDLYGRVAALGCPTVFLSVDTWQCLGDYLEAPKYDFVFSAQREFVPWLRAAGCRYVDWLPLACDPAVHHAAGRVADHDVVFVGSYSSDIHSERVRLLRALEQEFSVYIAEHVFGEAACETLARGRVVFNHSAVHELNMRIFEVLGSGGVLVTNREASRNGLMDLFEDGTHLVTYSGVDELKEQVRLLLDDDERRRRMAVEGRRLVLAQHTYLHRVDQILETVATHVTGFGETGFPIHRQGERLVDFLSPAPGFVLDVGLGLEVSRYALRRLGAGEVLGVAFSEEEAVRRRTSYDMVYVWPDMPPGPVDFAIVSGLEDGLAEGVVVLSHLHTVLTEGGTMALRLRPSSFDVLGVGGDVAAWLRQFGFFLVLEHETEGNDWILIARKRTRTLAEIVPAVFDRHPEAGVDVEEILRRIPPGL